MPKHGDVFTGPNDYAYPQNSDVELYQVIDLHLLSPEELPNYRYIKIFPTIGNVPGRSETFSTEAHELVCNKVGFEWPVLFNVYDAIEESFEEVRHDHS